MPPILETITQCGHKYIHVHHITRCINNSLTTKVILGMKLNQLTTDGLRAMNKLVALDQHQQHFTAKRIMLSSEA